MFHARAGLLINDNNKVYVSYGRQSQITDQPVSLGYIPSNSALYPGAVTHGRYLEHRFGHLHAYVQCRR